jgi:hypothetical protein
MMDAEDVSRVVRDAMEHGARLRPAVLPVQPFRAARNLADGETDAVNVIGIRFDPEAEDWKFVFVTSDGTGSLYVSEDDELAGDLPDIAALVVA